MRYVLLLAVALLGAQTRPWSKQVSAEQVRIWDGDTRPGTLVTLAQIRREVTEVPLRTLTHRADSGWPADADPETLVWCFITIYRVDYPATSLRSGGWGWMRAEWYRACFSEIGQREYLMKDPASGAMIATEP